MATGREGGNRSRSAERGRERSAENQIGAPQVDPRGSGPVGKEREDAFLTSLKGPLAEGTRRGTSELQVQGRLPGRYLLDDPPTLRAHARDGCRWEGKDVRDSIRRGRGATGVRVKRLGGTCYMRAVTVSLWRKSAMRYGAMLLLESQSQCPIIILR
eukprot:3196746-Rhodomonas_salina.1